LLHCPRLLLPQTWVVVVIVVGCDSEDSDRMVMMGEMTSMLIRRRGETARRILQN
jgi:hypothetical protein